MTRRRDEDAARRTVLRAVPESAIERPYRVKEVFATIQGEGYWTGTAAVFVRLAGCNAWSGHERDRGRDLARTGAACAVWCDTDFVGGEPLSRAALVARAREVAAAAGGPTHLVLTGGEPLLQAGAPLGLTWSCYDPQPAPCRACDACRVRAEGFAAAGVRDPAEET